MDGPWQPGECYYHVPWRAAKANQAGLSQRRQTCHPCLLCAARCTGDNQAIKTRLIKVKSQAIYAGDKQAQSKTHGWTTPQAWMAKGAGIGVHGTAVVVQALFPKLSLFSTIIRPGLGTIEMCSSRLIG